MNHTRYTLPAIALAAMSLTACGSDSPATVSYASSVTSQDAATKACATLFGKNGVDLAKATMLGTGDNPNVTMSAGISDDPSDRDRLVCNVQLTGDDSSTSKRTANLYKSLETMNRDISDTIGYYQHESQGQYVYVSAANSGQGTSMVLNYVPPQAQQQAQDKVNDLVKRLTK